MPRLSKHSEWLCFIDKTEPFLSVSILDKAFPQGLEAVETPRRQKLRAAYEEWREAVDQEDKLLPELHREWIRLVLTELLEYDHESLIQAEDWPDEIPSVSSQEHAGTFTPDWIVRSPADEKPRLFIAILPPDTDLESVQRGDSWPVSLHERMILLCRAHGVRVGLLTDGERWMLVNAPVGSTSSQASWYARLWFQESITLKAFQSLLGVRRCFGPVEDTLASLLDESLKHHEEITDTLGEQVRRAVEVLVQCLDKADEDRNRELLRDVKPAELYEAGLTVMMRLVFVLCAEERGLLLFGDSVYDRCYAVSTLRGQLAEEADRHGPEVLDRRHDAWARLLAVFRAVYGGIEHESLRMPALGGSLFDPDRFPFLEGRATGTSWRDTSAVPLPIDNRTVLLLLNSLQILEQSGGALLLSYRALDVEQIGHVYEGLLEHTVVRVPRVTLGLQGSQKAKNPNVALSELESAYLEGEAVLIKLVAALTGRSEPAIRNGLSKSVADTLFGRVLWSCAGDSELAQRISPFTNLLRTDAWGDPIVYRDNSIMVTLGVDRRETGTHYTPKSLTESIVTISLEPVVYIGPAEGKPREEWALKSSREILDLKVCDPAMGSGAFLVQACRYLGEKLVEAWLHEEAVGNVITVDGEIFDQLGAEEPLSSQTDERLTIARRLVAERCLYGVDVNPLAVELAKLSIWLVTLSKGRPFGFLDHNLRCGDSLLGIYRLEQLIQLRMETGPGWQNQLRFFGQNVKEAVKEAVELRKRIRSTIIRDITDIKNMERLDLKTREKLKSVGLIADAMIGRAIRFCSNSQELHASLDTLAILADSFVNGNRRVGEQLTCQVNGDLSIDLLEKEEPRKCFHWVLEFPEVFSSDGRLGFDSVIGNPPFKRGKDITSVLGTIYRDYIIKEIASGTRGSADLVVYFLLRCFALVRESGTIGLITSKSVSEGDSKNVGLVNILSKKASIFNAKSLINWPGKAQVVVSMIHIFVGVYNGYKYLNGEKVNYISEMLTSKKEWCPVALGNRPANAYQGVITHGDGFEISKEYYHELIECDNKYTDVVMPYLNGDDINNNVNQSASRYAICFWDWPQSRVLNGSWYLLSNTEKNKCLTEGLVPKDYPGPVAEDYDKVYDIVFDRVRPHRQAKKPDGSYRLRKPLPQRWWQYADKRPGMYHEIGLGSLFAKHPVDWSLDKKNIKNVIVRVQTTKHHSFSIVPSNQIINNTINVIASQDMALFALLSSEVHACWFYKYGSNLGVSGNNSIGYPRYFHTNIYETFPFCKLSNELCELGNSLISKRSYICFKNEIGITQFYNKVHDIKCIESNIIDFRHIMQLIEYEVGNSYGLDLPLLQLSFTENEYLPKGDRIRFTFGSEERARVLQRLEDLNREEYERQ